jgi:hypothetical protein
LGIDLPGLKPFHVDPDGTVSPGEDDPEFVLPVELHRN